MATMTGKRVGRNAESLADALAAAVEHGAGLGEREFSRALAGEAPDFESDGEWSGLVALVAHRVFNSLVSVENARRGAGKDGDAAGVRYMQDGGVWHAGRTFAAGACVSHKHHLWVARTATTDEPPSDNWRLILRGSRGR